MLCFWNDGNPQVIHNTRKVKMPNGDVIMNAKVAPELDLYEYEDQTEKPNEYQYADSATVENDGVKVVKSGGIRFKDVNLVKDMRVNEARLYVSDQLAKTDWMVIRAADGIAVPDDIQAYRVSLRAQSNVIESDIAALATAEDVVAYVFSWPSDPMGA